MFNVTVIRLKDIIKYLLALIVIIAVILGAKGYFFNVNLSEKISTFASKYILEPIKTEIPVASEVNKEGGLADENNDDSNEGFMNKILTGMIDTELEVISSVKNTKEDEKEIIVASNNDIEKNEIVENNETKEGESEDKGKSETVEKAKTDVKTEIVTKNPLKDNSTNKYNGVKIKNETKYELTDEILNPEGINIDKSNIIIFHTHTCESYTSSEKYTYTPTGNFRTTDKRYSVVRVGDELTNCLKEYSINVVHDTTFHDYPSYTGSYSRSLSTVSKILNNTKADIIIDLHRDAIGSYSSYAPTVKIGDDYCSQLMFVMGTNGSGLNHSNWQSNLKWAISIQQKANEIYPGLFKPIILRNSRYNQHLSKAACIIEVGATGNTLEQCLNSMKYLAAVINN